MADPIELRMNGPHLPCQGVPLNGHAHAGPVAIFLGICGNEHARWGALCQACSQPKHAQCLDCDPADPSPRILISAERAWGAMNARARQREEALALAARWQDTASAPDGPASMTMRETLAGCAGELVAVLGDGPPAEETGNG